MPDEVRTSFIFEYRTCKQRECNTIGSERLTSKSLMPAYPLAGRTTVVSGTSRGIALAAARGADIVLVAKTAQPHPKLPGTVHTAAEIEAAGGKAVAVEPTGSLPVKRSI